MTHWQAPSSSIQAPVCKQKFKDKLSKSAYTNSR
jgi:hypothetical protein